MIDGSKLIVVGAALIVLAGCSAHSHEAGHWSYDGAEGPGAWGDLSDDYAACGDGIQQSPVDLVGARSGAVEVIDVAWQSAAGQVVNNGHTIQVNVPPGSTTGLGGTSSLPGSTELHGPTESRFARLRAASTARCGCSSSRRSSASSAAERIAARSCSRSSSSIGAVVS